MRFNFLFFFFFPPQFFQWLSSSLTYCRPCINLISFTHDLTIYITFIQVDEILIYFYLTFSLHFMAQEIMKSVSSSFSLSLYCKCYLWFICESTYCFKVPFLPQSRYGMLFICYDLISLHTAIYSLMNSFHTSSITQRNIFTIFLLFS